MIGFLRRPTIRTRLALIYTGLLTAALVVFGGGVYVTLRDQLVRSFDASLIANAEHAAGAFAQDIDASGRFLPSARLTRQFAATGGRVVLLNASGSPLADSAPPGSPPFPILPSDLSAADQHLHSARDIVVPGDVLRLTVAAVFASNGTVGGYVAWAESARPLSDLLTTITLAFVIGGFLVAGGALLAGLVLARRALAPIADVTETARAISLSGDFAGRVEAGHPGDEVGELAMAFNEMLSALEQNHHALQRFLGDASHQLRTPLTTIRANLDLAARSEVPEEERRAILSDARDEAERMGRLISDLLSLARAESGARLELRPVELDALLVDSVRRLRQAAAHVRMSVASVQPAIVDGDRDRLRELFGILLDNAASYTPAGGSVVASLAVGDGSAVVRIEDTGIGVEPEERERVFVRLYRGRQARQMQPSGTGLGLAIARWIVESHGGTIELAGRDGGGTVVTVTLPAR